MREEAEMRRANARHNRDTQMHNANATCKCEKQVCNMQKHNANATCEHVRHTTLNVSATRTPSAQQSASSTTHERGKRQAHRSARTAKRKCDARARSITRRANATCKCRMFDAKTPHKSSNGRHVSHVPTQHTVGEQPDDDEDSKTQDQD